MLVHRNEEGKKSLRSKYAEAVFCGHMHEDHIFYDVDLSNMDTNTPEKSNPTTLKTLYFSSSTYYIETNTATKRYG